MSDNTVSSVLYSTPEKVAQGDYVTLWRRGTYEYVERHRGNGVVVLVPVTTAGELVLVEQPRPALGKVVIELPAGIVGDEEGKEEEHWLDAGKRELIEETGYHAAVVREVAAGSVSPGLSSETIHFILATGLSKVGEGGGIDDEEITVHVVALDQAEEWLEAQGKLGKIVDTKVYAGLYFASRAGSAAGCAV